MTIKNLKLKLFITNTVFPVLSFINKHLKHDKNIVLFYSNLAHRDNNKALYEYMIANGYNKKYKIIVSSSDHKDYLANVPNNVRFVGAFASIPWFFRSKYVFYTIGKLPISLGKGQKSIYMNHGMPFKDGSEGEFAQIGKFQNYFTYMLATGEAFIPCNKRIYGFPEERIVLAGNPTADNIFKPCPNYDFGKYGKLILWVPTFRKSTSMKMDDLGDDSALLPIIKDKELVNVNDYLKSINVKIVVKLHPEQDISNYNFINLDNFGNYSGRH